MTPLSEEPTARRTLTDSAYEHLRSAILDGRLRDGEPVNQVELSKRLGMSRVPIREAVQRLIAEGLLVGSSYRRATVAVVSLSEVAELVDIREVLEVLALSRMVDSPRPDSLERAEEVNRELAATNDPERMVQLDLEFHRALTSSMPAASRIVMDIRKRTQKYIDRLHLPGSPRRNGATEHAAVLQAVRELDGERAEVLLRQHIVRTRQLLLLAEER